MKPLSASEPAQAGEHHRLLARHRIDVIWVICSIGAALLILVGSLLPLWKLELVAPQYPKGLFINAYGYDMTGDLREINGLNHYVGLKPVKPDWAARPSARVGRWRASATASVDGWPLLPRR